MVHVATVVHLDCRYELWEGDRFAKIPHIPSTLSLSGLHLIQLSFLPLAIVKTQLDRTSDCKIIQGRPCGLSGLTTKVRLEIDKVCLEKSLTARFLHFLHKCNMQEASL